MTLNSPYAYLTHLCAAKLCRCPVTPPPLPRLAASRIARVAKNGSPDSSGSVTGLMYDLLSLKARVCLPTSPSLIGTYQSFTQALSSPASARAALLSDNRVVPALVVARFLLIWVVVSVWVCRLRLLCFVDGQRQPRDCVFVHLVPQRTTETSKKYIRFQTCGEYPTIVHSFEVAARLKDF